MGAAPDDFSLDCTRGWPAGRAIAEHPVAFGIRRWRGRAADRFCLSGSRRAGRSRSSVRYGTSPPRGRLDDEIVVHRQHDRGAQPGAAEFGAEIDRPSGPIILNHEASRKVGTRSLADRFAHGPVLNIGEAGIEAEVPKRVRTAVPHASADVDFRIPRAPGGGERDAARYSRTSPLNGWRTAAASTVGSTSRLVPDVRSITALNVRRRAWCPERWGRPGDIPLDQAQMAPSVSFRTP
jgi:hypothetical protein